MNETKLGKIERVSFGFGGRDDCMLGISFVFTGDGGSWGCGDFRGTWGPQIMHSQYSKWTEADRDRNHAETVRFIGDLLVEAKVDDVMALKNKPVEVTFERGNLVKWRLLTEVL